ncbi:MAG: hypothetical protein ACK5CA_13100 [Cyanobacteriota bacterium]|jgi:sugar lactone lactonase YvrE
MLDPQLLSAIAEEFIEAYDNAFRNPNVLYTPFTNLLLDDVVFAFPQEQQLFGTADVVIADAQFVGTTDTDPTDQVDDLLDFFVNGLTRFYPQATTVFEILPVAGEDNPDQERVAIRLNQVGAGTQTGRFFEQPATVILQIDEAAVNALDADTVAALLSGDFDPTDQLAKVVERVEFYSNSYAVHAATADGLPQASPVPDNDPLTFQPAYNFDPNADSAEAIAIATQIWESLALGDLYTPSLLHAADDPGTPENEGAIWSFAITGPDFLPYVGTAQGYTFDGQPLGNVDSLEEWLALLGAGDFITPFANAGPILGNILAQLGPVIQPGDIEVVGTYAEGNRVLVHVREGQNQLPVANETGNEYRAPLDILSWFTIEDGLVTANEVIVNTFATVSAVRPEEISPFGYSVGFTRHAPPFFVTGSRVNGQILTFDENGEFTGTLYEANSFDSPELLQPIGITYGPDGTLYVNSTLGALDNAPIVNAVLRIEGVYGDYLDGTTPDDRESRDRARDAVNANQLPRLQNVDPTRVADDPADPEDQPNDYNPALFGNAHGEYFDPATGLLIDPGSLTLVPFDPNLGGAPNTLLARPFDTEAFTLIDAATNDIVYADGETGTLFAVAQGPLTDVQPAAILSPTGELLAVFNGTEYINPANGQTVYTFERVVDPNNPVHITITFTDVATSATAFTFDTISDPRVIFDSGTGAPLGVAIPGLVIPSGVKFGPDDNLYVASAFTSRILQYDGETGEFLSVFATRENGVPVANLLDPAAGLPPDFTVFVFGPDGGIYVGSIRTDIDPTTGEPTNGDPTAINFPDGYGAVLRFPGPTWDIDEATGWYIDPLNGNLVEPGKPAGIAVNGTDLSAFGVFGETGGILAEGRQPLYEPSAVAFGPDLRLYVSSAQTGEVLVYEGPVLEDGSPNPNAGRYAGVYANVAQAVIEDTGREGETIVLSGMGFGPDGNLYVGSSFEAPEGTPNAGAPVGGSQFSVIVGPSPEAFGQTGTPGEYLGPYGDVTTEVSRLLLPTTPEFVYYSNTYTKYNEVTQRFPEIFYVAGVNADQPFDPATGLPGFFQDDGADAIAAYDRELNFLGYLGTPLVDGQLGQDIDLETNPLSGIGGVELAPNGDILVSSQLTDQILRYSSLTGQYLGVFGDASAEGSGLDFPAGIAISSVNAVDTGDPDGQRSGVFVSDLLNGRILRYDGYSGAFYDDPETEENEGVLAELEPELEGWRFTDLAFGPDGRIYVGLNSPLENSTLGSARVRVYNPETNTLEQEINGDDPTTADIDESFDFVAALTFGPDGCLYVVDDPASLVNIATGQPLAPGKESQIAIYEIDSIHPILIDPLTGNGSPDGARSAPELMNRFNVGVGNGGAISVTLDQASQEPVIFLSQPVDGGVALYTEDGTLQETLTPALPDATLGIDENGLPRMTGSTFIGEFIRPANYAQLLAESGNAAPTDITLSALSFEENLAPGSEVATLGAVDPDAGDTFTFRLISGGGDRDNEAFSIEGDSLKINASPDFESQDQYRIRLSVIDGGGLSVEKTFRLTVLDITPPLPDGFAANESAGSVYLLKDADNFLYAQDESGTPTSLKYLDQPFDSSSSEWIPLGAETLNGVNQVIWENSSTEEVGLWSTDENWNWLLSEIWNINTPQTLEQETAFQQDLNGDDLIGNAFTETENQGAVKLLQDLVNYFYVEGEEGEPAPLQYQNQPYDNRFGEWSPLAAEILNGENQVLWENTGAGQLGLWRANESWDWQLSDVWALASEETFIQEVNFGVDANGDGVIGQPVAELSALLAGAVNPVGF